MHLRGKRVIIRDFREKDAADFLAYAQDPAVNVPAGMRPVASLPEAKRILAEYRKAKSDFAIELGGHVIGHIGIYLRTGDPADDLADTREIGYALAKRYWGQGIMSEAVALVMAFLEQQAIREVWAAVFPVNARSIAVLTHAGFHYVFTVPLPAGLTAGAPHEEAYYMRQLKK